MAANPNVDQYEDLEKQVRRSLAGRDLTKLRARLADEHPANIAGVLDRLNHPQRHKIFELLSTEKKAKVLDEMSITATRQVLDRLSSKEIGALLDLMPMDEAAEIIYEDAPNRKDELLAAMSPEQAAEVRRLLQYPPESAGRMMTEKFARLKNEMTAENALAYVRKVDKNVETLTDLYILDEEERLIGVVSLRDLVVASPKQRVDKLMNTQLVTVTPEKDREEVARLVSHYDYLAMPVVTSERKMLGIIPVDDVIDVLVSETTEDILKFGGMEGGVAINQPYFSVSIPTVIRKRVGWLLLLFLAETFTGTVLRHFEDELAKVVALSFFIPLLIGTGGNTGAQTVSTLIRGLALGEVKTSDIWRVILRELSSGLLIGILLGLIAFGRALLWGSTTQLAITVGLTILAICTWANTIGALIPLIAHKVKIDPAVVSAPLITTLVDATGLAIYMLIAKAILGL
jgi:magnesium transporter